MKKKLLVICVLFAVSSSAYADMGAYDAGAIGQQNIRDLIIHDVQKREERKNAIIHKNYPDEQKKVNIPAAATTIKNIRFVGNEALPAGDLARIVSGYLGKPASDKNISAARKLVTKYYQANGFYSVIVVPDTNSLVSGTLTFEIKEGQKNSITIQ